MSREIKFRIWDKYNHEYWHYLRPEIVFDSDGAAKIEFYIGGAGKFHDYRDGDFVIQQFTGLKDKNEKEIYEGDILRIKLPDTSYWQDEPRQIWNAEVKYEEDRGGYILQFREHGRRQPYIDLNYDSACDAEILGNIFENPDLLGQ